MVFQTGQPKIGGRQPGSINKLTKSVKEAFAEAFDRMGGADALVEWGKENPTDFYKLASKLIPVDVSLGIKQIPTARAFPKEPVTIDNDEQLNSIDAGNTLSLDCVH